MSLILCDNFFKITAYPKETNARLSDNAFKNSEVGRKAAYAKGV